MMVFESVTFGYEPGRPYPERELRAVAGLALLLARTAAARARCSSWPRGGAPRCGPRHLDGADLEGRSQSKTGTSLSPGVPGYHAVCGAAGRSASRLPPFAASPSRRGRGPSKRFGLADEAGRSVRSFVGSAEKGALAAAIVGARLTSSSTSPSTPSTGRSPTTCWLGSAGGSPMERRWPSSRTRSSRSRTWPPGRSRCARALSKNMKRFHDLLKTALSSRMPSLVASKRHDRPVQCSKSSQARYLSTFMAFLLGHLGVTRTIFFRRRRLVNTNPRGSVTIRPST